jgi:hypothetical protein
VRGCVIVSRQKSSFEPDGSWDLNDIKLWVSLIEPSVAGKIRTEEQCGSEENILEEKKLSLRRAYFLAANPKYTLPSRAKFESLKRLTDKGTVKFADEEVEADEDESAFLVDAPKKRGTRKEANTEYLHDPSDFRGGIMEPENATKGQVLDARNVWAPKGTLEQRPGLLQVTYPRRFMDVLETDRSELDYSYWAQVASDETTVITSATTASDDFDPSTASAGQYIYYGLSDSVYSTRAGLNKLRGVTGRQTGAVANTAATTYVAEYYTGTQWKRFHVRQIVDFDINGSSVAEYKNYLVSLITTALFLPQLTGVSQDY